MAADPKTMIFEGLTVAKRHAMEMQRAKNATKIISICSGMEQQMINIQSSLSIVKSEYDAAKSGTDNALVRTRQNYNAAEQRVNATQQRLNSLQSNLRGQQSSLRDYENRTRNVQNQINQKREAAKAKETEAIIVGVFTLGIGYGIIHETEVKDLEKQQRNLESERRSIENRIREIRGSISNTEREIRSQQSQRDSLRREQNQLDQKSKKLGRQIVSLGNASKNASEGQIKCAALRLKVDSVKTLAIEDLIELIDEPVKEVILAIDGVKSSVNGLKAITY